MKHPYQLQLIFTMSGLIIVKVLGLSVVKVKIVNLSFDVIFLSADSANDDDNIKFANEEEMMEWENEQKVILLVL